jgi:hypothetical protein
MRDSRAIARARRRAAKLLWRLALGPTSGLVPSRHVRSLVQSSARPAVAKHIEEISVLAPAHVERYDFDPALPPRFRREHAFVTRNLYRLGEVCVSGRTGLAWLPRGPILLESYGGPMRVIGWESFVLEEPLLDVKRRIDGPVVSLPQGNYYHWLAECLPAALHGLAAEPDATLVVPAEQPRYAREIVEALGLTKVVRTDEPFVAEQLVLPAREERSGWMPIEDVAILRTTFLPRAATVDRVEAFYVTRRLTTRRAANEGELERVCSRRGIEPIEFETLPFLEQVALWAGVRTVVAPHGAGLVNLAFASPGGRLLELFTASPFNDCYARLALGTGLGYEPFYCSGADNASSVAPLEEIEAALA